MLLSRTRELYNLDLFHHAYSDCTHVPNACDLDFMKFENFKFGAKFAVYIRFDIPYKIRALASARGSVATRGPEGPEGGNTAARGPEGPESVETHISIVSSTLSK